MRCLVCLFLSLLMLTGCSRRAVPPAAVAPAAVGGEPALAGDEGHEPVPAGVAVYQGRSAETWARGLDSPDNGVRREAGMALRTLGKEGYPHLVNAIRNSRSAETRLAALQALYKTELVSHQSDTLPLLLRLLQTDPNPALREQAAIRLAWFDERGRAALAALQNAAQTDPDAGVRQAAANSYTCLHEAVTGTIKRTD
jgi:hypothetical protein